MVRGDPNCQNLCTKCRNDCVCEAQGCGLCHTCRDVDQRSINYYGYTSIACITFTHDCTSFGGEPSTTKAKMLMLPKLLSSETTEIIIDRPGYEKESRFVSKKALIENSDFFKTWFSFESKSAPENDSQTRDSAPHSRKAIVLNTEVDRLEVFDRFIQFCYWKDYVATPSDSSHTDIEIHAQVYALAERLQSAGLKDLALRKAGRIAAKFGELLVEKSGLEAELECIFRTIDTIYSGTPSRSTKDPFRVLIAALCQVFISRFKSTGWTNMEECVGKYPDFAMDMLAHFASGRKVVEFDNKGHLLEM